MKTNNSTKNILILALIFNLIFNLILKFITYTPHSFPLGGASYESVSKIFGDLIILVLMVQVAIDSLIFYFIKKRAKENNEKISEIWLFFLFLASFTLLNIPIVNMGLIYSVIKNESLFTKKEKINNISESESINEIEIKIKPSEANSTDLKQGLMIGGAIIIIIVVIKIITLYL